ncbi:MAG: glycosyltransferase family 2 protein [Candidatus Omnitrophica bacterium]|nr:glycosyltransferase family 2 protein [Candidatus Omnitrophota bacterium]
MNQVDRKLKSLSIFFPCYNDGGAIASMVVCAQIVGRKVSEDFEVIVVDDCSSDNSPIVLEELKSKYQNLKVIKHSANTGYGGALKAGFSNAKKEFVFYTDGDAQYRVSDLEKLVPLMNEDIDIVNGYKMNRCDPFYRIIIGKAYNLLMKVVFGIKIKDVDCDFRLMRRKVFDGIELRYNSGVICVEMIKKIQDAGFKFAEVGVTHYFRAAGKSQFFNFKRLLNVLVDLAKLKWKLSFKRGR